MLVFSDQNLIIRASHLGSLAQSVEQLAFNQLVAGSNPARPTIYLKWYLKLVNVNPCGSLAQSVEQLAFNQLVAGSNPARPTTFSTKFKRALAKAPFFIG
jgi:hypothetical protein